jgi:UDP-hydrolysing UDP-N-acetyl-D-glucosamine 2-epimerase
VILSNRIKKICVVVNSRANYARIKSLLVEINKNKKFKLILVLGASATLYRFGRVDKVMRRDHFKIIDKLFSVVEGNDLIAMPKTTGLSIIELSNILKNNKPDLVVAIADRYENLSIAISASYMNIPVAHIQGGETTGSIDEKVRHAITKLSDIHFVSTKRAKDFVIRMGELKSKVFLTGCPSIDLLKNINFNLPKNFFIKRGSGGIVYPNENYILVIQHPVTTEFDNAEVQIEETIEAVKMFCKKKDYKVVWLWPNIDAGSDTFSKKIRIFQNTHPNYVRFIKNFTPEDYAKVMKNSKCVVGNSSSGIREASFLGVPSVNIGTRQSNRERGPNVRDVNYDRDEIYKSITQQVNKKFKKSLIYGSGDAGKKIAKILLRTNFTINKKLSYLG